MAAGDGLREEVGDPLAFNPNSRGADRSLPTYGIRNPGQTGGKVQQGALGVIDSIQATLGQIATQNMDTSRTEGKLAFMSGATEADIAKKGDKAYMQGWQSLKAASDGNEFMQTEAQFIENEGRQMSPQDYQKHLMDSRKAYLENLPSDPVVRKTFAATFEDYGPRLSAAQAEQHNAFNEQQQVGSMSQYLATGAPVQQDASYPVMDGHLRVSDSVVSNPVKYSAQDLDNATRTILGEAGGEGPQGMAAVASVIANRTHDSRYPQSVSDVVLQPKQFSAWNNGAGGNNPLRYDPKSAAYQQAQQIAQAVFDGHVVDQTGGATHYYAPGGMEGGKAPDWWSDESAKSGGTGIKIGNQLFAGRISTQASSSARGKLVFDHSDQTHIQPALQNILEGTAGALGGQLKITSGFRSVDHPVEAAKIAAGGSGGEHTHGDAADIDMSGMSDAQRSALVQDLRARGAKRFITYSDEKNMLHVDLKDQPGANGGNWFMFDKTNKKLDQAPKWFQDVAASPAQTLTDQPISGMATPQQAAGALGVPTNENGGAQQSLGRTRIQTFMANAPGKLELKATALADAMRRQLQAGDDTLFNDAGGTAGLSLYNPKPSEIDEVIRAKKAFDDNQDKKYDSTREKWRAGILERATSGGFADLGEAIDTIDARVKAGTISDAEAKSLSREVATEIEKSKDTVVPLELRDFAAQQYKGINSGLLDAHEASTKTIELAKKLGVKDSVVNNFVASMYAKADERAASLKTEVKTELEKQEKENAIKTNVQHALTVGTGLKGMSGTIRRNNPDTGVKEEVNAVQYGIDTLKDSVSQQAKNDVDAGRITPEQAGPQMVANVYENLAKQGVPDVKFGNAMASAVTGEVVDKSGKVSDGALRSLDQYMQMTTNPNIGTAYMKQMIQDDSALTFLETAKQQYAADLDMPSAIRRASQILSAPITPDAQIERTQTYTRTVRSAVDSIVGNISNDVGFWGKVFGAASAYTPQQIAEVTKDGTATLDAQLSARADAYHARNNREPMAVSVEKAKADLANDTVIVGSNIVVGKYDAGERIDQKMFGRDSGFQREDVQKAIDWKLSQVGKDVWGALWQEPATGIFRNGNFGGNSTPLSRAQGPSLPPYQLDYDPKQGTGIITLYKDASRTETVGKPIPMDMTKLGAEYAKLHAMGEAGWASNAWRTAKEGLAKGLETVRTNPKVAAEAITGGGITDNPVQTPAGAIGGMFKQHLKTK